MKAPFIFSRVYHSVTGPKIDTRNYEQSPQGARELWRDTTKLLQERDPSIVPEEILSNRKSFEQALKAYNDLRDGGAIKVGNRDETPCGQTERQAIDNLRNIAAAQEGLAAISPELPKALRHLFGKAEFVTSESQNLLKSLASDQETFRKLRYMAELPGGIVILQGMTPKRISAYLKLTLGKIHAIGGENLKEMDENKMSACSNLSFEQLEAIGGKNLRDMEWQQIAACFYLASSRLEAIGGENLKEMTPKQIYNCRYLSYKKLQAIGGKNLKNITFKEISDHSDL